MRSSFNQVVADLAVAMSAARERNSTHIGAPARRPTFRSCLLIIDDGADALSHPTGGAVVTR
jgi:hypothetical protein